MTDKPSSSSLVQKLALLVLLLILGCLGALLYQLHQPPPPAAPARVASPEPAVEAPAPPPATSSNTPAAAPVARPVTPSARPLVFEALPTGSEMRIDGDSTLHKWHCLGALIPGKFEVDPVWLAAPPQTPGGVPSPKCELKIPIRTLKSQVPVGASVMDSRMQAEMKMKQFPAIEYRLTRLVAAPPAPATNGAVDFTRPLALEATGDLAISGVTNQVKFPVVMEWVGTNALRFTGHYDTKMTAFGIKPPEFTVLGAGVRTADDITLTWKWCVGLKQETLAGQ